MLPQQSQTTSRSLLYAPDEAHSADQNAMHKTCFGRLEDEPQQEILQWTTAEVQLQQTAKLLLHAPLGEYAALSMQSIPPPKCCQAKKIARGNLLGEDNETILLLSCRLGEGVRGKVDVANYQGELVAVKKFSLKKLVQQHPSWNYPQSYLHEARAEARYLYLGQSAITPTKIYYTDKKAYMLEPFMLGDFQGIVKALYYTHSSPTVSPPLAAGLALCLLEGVIPCLKRLHQQYLAHVDVKALNILYRGTGITLGDYGSVKSHTDSYNESSLVAPEHIHDTSKDGSPTDNRKIDIWCLGQTALQIASRKFFEPYLLLRENSAEKKHHFLNNYLSAYHRLCNPEQATANNEQTADSKAIHTMFTEVDGPLQGLLIAMCHPCPSRRLTIEAITRQMSSLKESCYKNEMIAAKIYLQKQSIKTMKSLKNSISKQEST